jgi:outer membrane protein assembly factor BamB
MRHAALAILATLFAAAAPAPGAPASGDWPGWRGPHHNGSGDASGLPETWSATENTLWTAPLPGAGAATPAVVGDRVYVSTIDDASKELVALAFDRKTGKPLWKKTVGVGGRIWRLRPGLENNMASCSPVADADRAVFLFATGDLAAFAPDGKPLWARNLVKDLGPFVHLWGYGSSPLLYRGTLYVPILRRDKPYDGPAPGKPLDSLLVAIDPKTGSTKWAHARPTEAKEEAQEAYSTPIPREEGGTAEILLSGGDCVTGHDPATGKERWRWGEWNPGRVGHWRLVPSPLAAEGLVFIPAPKKEPFFAIKPSGAGAERAWSDKACTPDVCTPLYFNGRVYALDGDRKLLVAFDPKTGEKKATASLPGKEVFRASPTGADGRIWCINEDGTVSVLAPEDLKILATIPMGDKPCRASIAAAGRQLVIRTAKTLHAIGKP